MIFSTKENWDNICVVKLVQCVTQCTRNMKGPCFSFTYIEQKNLNPRMVSHHLLQNIQVSKPSQILKDHHTKEETPWLPLSNCQHGNPQELVTISKEFGDISTLPHLNANINLWLITNDGYFIARNRNKSNLLHC